MKLRIKKGDTVQIIAGNDKGKHGRVLALYPEKMRVLVEGINVRVRHTRQSQQNQQGGIIHKEMPIHYSNVLILDEKNKPTRIGVKTNDNNGKAVKVRLARTTGKEL